ncbi:Ig-like domain-containing protein [Anaeromyxobacter sp. SG64]|uniref:Ig-like domain-containing protein n=1 Tax=Anaeromyxobacter sp. SG64 TaxID=2925409 RepID=UPI001F57C09D|nr:Ig-like domain-containing protein [Anaeromyxobacter sp. SG64]
MALPRRAEPGVHALLWVIASVLLATAAPARAAPGARAAEGGAPAGGGALKLSARPTRLVLGQDGTAELRIWAPPEVEELTLSASAGRVEGIRRLPNGGFAARYRPPAERFPQVAIIAATARGAAGPLDGWMALPLYGQGDAKVRASPGQSITLRIGDRAFGPRIVGEDGLAVIPVVVPPGVHEAHHGFRPIDLHVPETPLVHAVALRATVQADRQEQVRVVAYVVAPHGAARRGDVPVVEPSRGSVSVSAREAGAYEVLWTLPPGPAGEERLAVRLAGAPASKALVRVGVVPGRAAAVALAFDREAFVADGDAPAEVVVTARMVDAAGNPTPGGAVTLGAEGGTISRPVERAPGVHEARLVVPQKFGSRREVLVTARAEAEGLSGSRALPLLPGPPASARVEERVIVADGVREATLRATVQDRYGNPVTQAPVVTAARGKVLEVAPAGEGVYRVRYLPPMVAARSEDSLAFAAGDVRSRKTLVLVPPRGRDGLLLAAGVAAGRGGALGPRVGLALERDLASAPAGLLLSLRLEAEWMGQRRRRELAGDGEEVEITSSAGGLLAGVSARRELGGLTAWVAGSAGLVLESSRPGDAGAAPGGRLSLGLGRPQQRGMPFVEAALLAAGRGALPAFTFSVGVRLGRERSHGDDPDRR